jgi:hypothetical protein
MAGLPQAMVRDIMQRSPRGLASGDAAADGDESVEAFFSRRFSPGVAQRLIDPLVSGIYAGDTRKLSVESTFPSLAALERQHGSVLIGTMKEAMKKAEVGVCVCLRQTLLYGAVVPGVCVCMYGCVLWRPALLGGGACMVVHLEVLWRTCVQAVGGWGVGGVCLVGEYTCEGMTLRPWKAGHEITIALMCVFRTTIVVVSRYPPYCPGVLFLSLVSPCCA